MVFNFHPLNLSQLSGFPQMSSTLDGWEQSIQLVKVTQKIVQGDAEFPEEVTNFLGVVQPLKTEDLQFKPENLRSWQWLWIHAKAGTLNLNTNDKVIFNGKRYKVYGKKDYSLNGYVEYEIVEDYENAN